MFEIDKSKFGAFVAELRKEKGYTQKELAEKLFISAKAVSKWETAVSIPDTVLLIPLSELLGVTVTELLLCERMEEENPMDAGEVESIVKTAISYAGEETARAYQTKGKWPLLYATSLLAGMAGTLFAYGQGQLCSTLITFVVLGAVFGAYFCFFVRTTLPTFYDENRCGLYVDGPFRINIPGVAFRNSNWPHIVRVGRIWSCAVTGLYPILHAGISHIRPEHWAGRAHFASLALLLGGLFIPLYIAAKKHE